MGLLDDAIREHLDLKRRHGASDHEIAQKEAEALGPARREFPRAAEQDVALEDAPVELPEEDGGHPLGDPLAEEIGEPPVFDPFPASDGPVADPAPPPAPRAELADTEEYRFEEEEEEDEEDDDDLLDDDDDLSDPDDDEDDEDEDLLGDTPEFLQDTPEHDRLWFEQKPPRDFDFE
jgi:hypothetical protein